MKKSLHPEVSILLPVHGDISFLYQTIDSVIRQTFVDFELIVINDRLDDHQVKKVSQLIASDKRCRLVTSQGFGLVSALNTGLELSLGSFIARIDSDDIMLPNRLEAQLNFLKSHPDVAVVGSQMIFIDANNSKIGKSRYPTTSSDIVRTLTFQNCVGHPTVMFRKIEVMNVGSYVPFFQGAEDYDLWTRVSLSRKIVNLNMYLTYYRITPGQYSRQLGRKSELLSESIRYQTSYPQLFKPTLLRSFVSEGDLSNILSSFRSEVSRIDPSFVRLNRCLTNVQRYFKSVSFADQALLILNLIILMFLSPKVFYRMVSYNIFGKFTSFFERL
jgi:glycosyltransferase involved in cell wall biosynthesis